MLFRSPERQPEASLGVETEVFTSPVTDVSPTGNNSMNMSLWHLESYIFQCRKCPFLGIAGDDDMVSQTQPDGAIEMLGS